jgi:hypothetical protein
MLHRHGVTVEQLRLVCLVRSGDGYVVRGSGRLPARGDGTTHVDITFGDTTTAGGGCPDLDAAVRHIQRWCDLGTPVALLTDADGLALRADDGTVVPLPACAA